MLIISEVLPGVIWEFPKAAGPDIDSSGALITRTRKKRTANLQRQP